MKALIYATATLVGIVVLMNIASGIANNTGEKLENKLNSRYNIEQQLNK